MISREHRFHGPTSVQTVYRRGQAYRGSSLGLKVVKRDPAKPYRIAVVVSKKVSKSAVVRNRIRRRIYEAVRTSATPVPGGYDLVFTVFSEQFAVMESAALAANIHNLLKRVVLGVAPRGQHML